VAGNKTIGVLALQGAFAKHLEALADLGLTGREVRKPEELQNCDALIIPGGESTTIRQLLEYYDFFPELPLFAQERPLLGSCAGLILMAKKVQNERDCLNLLDLTVERNAYGSQTNSFRAPITLSNGAEFPAIFIRAPKITQWNDEVEVLASYQGSPIWVKQGHHMAVAFHPELTNNRTVHAAFCAL
jgi:5'-phosphate synthase pdxT subunit